VRLSFGLTRSALKAEMEDGLMAARADRQEDCGQENEEPIFLSYIFLSSKRRFGNMALS
jgi:hypothetical protein